MKSDDVVNLVKLLESHKIEVWIDGGWGVDALLGEQTRSHEDVDIVIQSKDVDKLRKLLGNLGYKNVPRDDTRDWNFVLGDNQNHLVDVHVVTFDEKGNGIYGPKERGVMYPAESFSGEGRINGTNVKCISVKYQIESHSGYKLRDRDFWDVSALCKKFDLDLPKEHSNIIRNADIKSDGDRIFEIWECGLGEVWPLEKTKFLELIQTGGTEGMFAALKEGILVGFVITKIGKMGEIMVIIVDKKWQRKGIGTTLLTKAMDYFREKGIIEVQLGAGANPYLWPGVPDNLPDATAFFEKLGWKSEEESVDMIGDLGGYITPVEINKNINELGIRLVIADKTMEKEVIEFENANFPQWVNYFESALAGESGEEVLVAINRNNGILGTALVGKKSIVWNKLEPTDII